MLQRRFSLSVLFFLGMAACQPPRAPIRRPLEIKGTPPASVSSPKPDMVRIGIRLEVEKADITSESSIEVTDLMSGSKVRWDAGAYALSVRGGKIVVNGKVTSSKMKFSSDRPDVFLSCRGLGYRGDLIVRALEDEKLTVINELGIDDYLKGVLPREVVVSWPEESLKVQAVASRTYLASHLGSHGKEGFDLCSDVHCQVYGGVAKEHPRTTAAVEETKGEILVWMGKPVGAFFHSNCGGSTEQIQPVWGSANKPYLPKKKCDYGTADPRYRWRISMSEAEILSALKSKTEVKGKKLISLKIKKKSATGRAEKMTVETDAGTYEMSGNSFRIALHPEKIRSTLFTSFKRHGNGYEFAGRGWGHGVGMCQWGSKGQAEHGRLYRDILHYYYPNTELKLWSR